MVAIVFGFIPHSLTLVKTGSISNSVILITKKILP
jgi:hypothetical protein